MERDPEWRVAVERVRAAFGRADADALGALLRGTRASSLPALPGAAHRLLVIQGLERAERCAAAGRLDLSRVEFEHAVARAEEPASRSGGGVSSAPPGGRSTERLEVEE